ncbi:MAG: hypothetical protein HUU55_21705 [Myxococcales bacterium]|nr:hypothetical protein [Myxococcales bacterium]
MWAEYWEQRGCEKIAARPLGGGFGAAWLRKTLRHIPDMTRVFRLQFGAKFASPKRTQLFSQTRSRRWLGCLSLVWAACSAGGVTDPQIVPDDVVGDGLLEQDLGNGAAPTGTQGIFTAVSSLDVAWWTPVGAGGVGNPLRLSPERGLGFGQGQGSVAYPIVAPDGKTVVVVFYPLTGGSLLYALFTDGSSQQNAVLLADAPDLSALERDISSTMLAYVSKETLYVVPLDGSGVHNPTKVATASPGERIEKPQWVKGQKRLTYRLTPIAGGKSRVLSAAADGSEYLQPIPLMVAGEPVDWVAGLLPGGKIIVRGDDDRLFVMTATGDNVIPISPLGKLATVAGISDSGHRVALELRTNSFSDRELISVSILGTDTENPVVLTETPVGTLTSVAAESGGKIAWVVPEDGGKWGLYAGSFDDPAAFPRHLIAPLHGEKLYLTDYSAAGGAVVVSTESGNVYVADVTPGAPKPLRLLFSVPEIVNHSFPWPTFSADGNHVMFSANTPKGWQAWAVPTAGGETTEVMPPWYTDLIGPFGILASVPTTRSAIWTNDVGGGQAKTVTVVHESPILFPDVDEGTAYVLYATAHPKPGWYVGATDGNDAGAPLRIIDLPDMDSYIMPADRPTIVGDFAVSQKDGVLSAFSLSSPVPNNPVVLVPSGVTTFVTHPKTGRIFWAVGKDVQSITVPPSGSSEWGTPMVVMSAVEPPQGLLVTADGTRVVAVTQGADGARVLAARANGEDVNTPWVVDEGVIGWPMGAALSPAGDTIVVIYSVMPTAVPHPDLMLVSTVQPTPNSRRVVPAGFLPWGMAGCCDIVFQPADPRFMTPDGVWGIFVGPDGLYSARMDGSHAADPILLGEKTAQAGDGLSPDGKGVLSADATGVYLGAVGIAGSQRLLASSGNSVRVRSGNSVRSRKESQV